MTQPSAEEVEKALAWADSGSRLLRNEYEWMGNVLAAALRAEELRRMTWMEDCRKMEAARDALQAKLADIEESYRVVIEERPHDDERHCTCVPALRHKVEAQRKLVQDAHAAFHQVSMDYHWDPDGDGDGAEPANLIRVLAKQRDTLQAKLKQVVEAYKDAVHEWGADKAKLSAAEAENKRHLNTFERIANPQCGCRPKCQCLEPGQLAIYREEVRSMAQDELDRAHTKPTPDREE